MLSALLLLSALFVPIITEAEVPDVLGKHNNAVSSIDKVNYADEEVSGSNIFLEMNATTWVISNITLFGSAAEYTPIRELAIEGFEPTDVKTAGSVLKLDSENITVKIHDNPTGMIAIHIGDGPVNISFLLGDEFSVTSTYSFFESGSVFTAAMVEGQGIRGVITISNGTLDVDTTELGTYVNMSIDQGMVKLRFKPVDSSSDYEEDVLEGVLQNRIAGEVYVYLEEDDVSYDIMEYAPGFTAECDEATSQELCFSVSSSAGRNAIIVNIIDSTGEVWDEALIALEGDVIRAMSSIYDVIYRNDVAEPLCSFTVDDENYLAALLVPDGSAFMFSIERVSGAPVSDDLPIFTPIAILLELGVVAIMVLAGVFLFRRR